MLYYLFDWLHNSLNIPGAGVFQYISFRAAGAIITSLLITIVFGKKLIELLRRKQVGETVRDLGLEGQKAKEGTPTMGGLIILAAILIPTLLFAKLDNIYVIIMLITTVWLGALGFIDDYIKVVTKENKIAWVCTVCGYVEYLEILPDDYKCPVCGVDKTYFKKL